MCYKNIWLCFQFHLHCGPTLRPVPAERQRRFCQFAGQDVLAAAEQNARRKLHASDSGWVVQERFSGSCLQLSEFYWPLVCLQGWAVFSLKKTRSSCWNSQLIKIHFLSAEATTGAVIGGNCKTPCRSFSVQASNFWKTLELRNVSSLNSSKNHWSSCWKSKLCSSLYVFPSSLCGLLLDSILHFIINYSKF